HGDVDVVGAGQVAGGPDERIVVEHVEDARDGLNDVVLAQLGVAVATAALTATLAAPAVTEPAATTAAAALAVVIGVAAAVLATLIALLVAVGLVGLGVLLGGALTFGVGLVL